HDWCILHLGETGTIRLVDINTAHFTGNYPPGAMLEAAYCADGNIDKAEWKTVIDDTKLGPDAHHLLTAHDVGPVNIVRLNIYPDGGIARLRLFGDVQRDWSDQGDAPAELSALRSGGCILGYNDAHYGDVNALISEGRGQTMGDGWETRRRREPGHDWIIVRLGTAGLISDIEVDTAHFKGNYPDRCSLQAALIEGDVDLDAAENWPELMGEKSLSADNIHKFSHADINDVGPINVVRLNIFPDGGVSRLRLFGKVVT
ncbi:MAG: allantoicase, partial [Candidatus Puniceispirillum sp.]